MYFEKDLTIRRRTGIIDYFRDYNIYLGNKKMEKEAKE
jgi:hypothetical protein